MKSGRTIKIAIVLLGALVCVGGLMTVTVATRVTHACILCRIERTEQTYLGSSKEEFRESGFTRWYLAHRPAHDHLWAKLTCKRGSSIFGTTTYFGCSPRHPGLGIPIDSLEEFAKKSDQVGLDRYFDSITSTNLDLQLKAVASVWKRLGEQR